MLIKETNNIDEINFFLNNYWNKIGIFVTHEKSLNEMEEVKRSQGSTFDTISRRKLIGDRDAILELTAKIQELQKEINCMNDSRDFQDLESVRSGQSHFTSQPVFFPTSSRSWRNAVLWECRAATMGREVFGTRMVNRVTFLQIQRRLLPRFFPQGSNPWVSKKSKHTSPHVMSESQTPVQDQRCHASQDRQPVIHSFPVREDVQKMMGQTANLGTSF